MTSKTGGCQCGRVRYRADCPAGDGAPTASLCHCRMCQRATGGFAAALVAFPPGAVAWDHEPAWYASSPIAQRPFCPACGTPLGFRFNGSDRLELTLGSFDDPSGFFPVHHAGAESLLEPWIDLAALPRKRSDEAQSVVSAWHAAGLTIPELIDAKTTFIAGDGGVELAVHRQGAGRPVLLLHGLFSSAQVNWIKFGTAAKLAEAGFEAIMPDLRAHGQSAAPHDPLAYPADVLVRDALAVVRETGLSDYDLGGFSLGSRTAVRAVLAGLTPRRLVLGGMGWSGLAGWARRATHFIDAIDRFGTIARGEPAFLAQAFMKTMNIDRVAARLLLQSVDDTPPEALAAIGMPTLVVCGADDHDNGSAPELAQALPDARYAEVPGNHMSSVTKPEFGDAIVDFLAAPML